MLASAASAPVVGAAVAGALRRRLGLDLLDELELGEPGPPAALRLGFLREPRTP